ncbi:MFS transporter [Streptomyces sp. CBMA152]|uniref:MFS transporter n=1 Tax=Streptomyces sp. CBMA152 TaxID=1896312 RepID=UPI001660B853|nr:MFS transporter [Streptomyces sp. CBMA152]MBD0743145.1 transporter [Streptomyces sp. CBMA152]
MKKTSEGERIGVFAALKATPRTARFLLGGIFVNQMGAFVQTFLVLYLVHNHWSTKHAGLCLGAYSLGALAGGLIGGELTQRLGPRNTIITAMSCSALLVASLPLLKDPGNYGFVVALVGAAGAATAAYRPGASALLNEAMPEELRVMAFSMMRTALNLGSVIGPFTAAALTQANWDLLYWVDGATALGYALFSLAFLPAKAADSHGTSPQAVTEVQPAKKIGYLAILRDTKFALYLASMTLSAMFYMQFMAVLPLKVQADGHPIALYSSALALSSGLLITLELKITSYVSHWKAPVAAGIGTLVMSLGLTAYAISGAPVVILLGTAVFVSGMMTSGPTLWAHPAKKPAEVKGRYIGSSQAAFSLGSATGTTLGVLAWGMLGNGIWLLCGAIGAIAALCAAYGLSETREKSRQQDISKVADATAA